MVRLGLLPATLIWISSAQGAGPFQTRLAAERVFAWGWHRVWESGKDRQAGGRGYQEARGNLGGPGWICSLS